MLGVPIHVEGRVIGVMHIGPLVKRAFDEDDVMLLQLAADRAALAIDSARLSEHRSVTAMMQRSLLPDVLPQIPGLRFSAKYLPAGSGIKIGGDWYHVFQLHNGHLAFVIGDVVGRGVLAASVMAEIRASLRAYTMQKDTSSPRLSRCSTSCWSRWAATAAPHSASWNSIPKPKNSKPSLPGTCRHC